MSAVQATRAATAWPQGGDSVPDGSEKNNPSDVGRERPLLFGYLMKLPGEISGPGEVPLVGMFAVQATDEKQRPNCVEPPTTEFADGEIAQLDQSSLNGPMPESSQKRQTCGGEQKDRPGFFCGWKTANQLAYLGMKPVGSKYSNERQFADDQQLEFVRRVRSRT